MNEFSDIGTVYGADGNDQFTIADGASLTSSLNGNDGTNSMIIPDDSLVKETGKYSGILYSDTSSSTELLSYYNIQSITGSSSVIITTTLYIGDSYIPNLLNGIEKQCAAALNIASLKPYYKEIQRCLINNMCSSSTIFSTGLAGDASSNNLIDFMTLPTH